MFQPRVHRSRWAAGFTAAAVTLVLTGPLGPTPARAAAADPKNTPTEAVSDADGLIQHTGLTGTGLL